MHTLYFSKNTSQKSLAALTKKRRLRRQSQGHPLHDSCKHFNCLQIILSVFDLHDITACETNGTVTYTKMRQFFLSMHFLLMRFLGGRIIQVLLSRTASERL